MRKFSSVLIIIGVMVGLYPFMARGYTWYWQQKLLAEYNDFSEIENIKKNSEEIEEVVLQEYHELQLVFEAESSLETNILYESNSGEKEIRQENELNRQITVFSKEKNIPQNKMEVLGILKIDKINVKLPILEGATDKNLKIGVGRINNTTNIGDVGNTALAAHRSHTYGRLFNRLDELDIGDEILIEKGVQIFRYEIYKKHIVDPNDTSVLNPNNENKMITLITCHPIFNPTHRLILHGLLIEN